MPGVAGQFRVRDRVVLQQPLDGRLRAGWSADPGIHAGVDAVRGVGGEEDRIGEVVRTARNAELAILDVAPEVCANLHVVIAVGHRHHVGIGVDVLPEVLRVSVVGTEPCRRIIELHLGDTGNAGANQVHVLHITQAQFVQDCGAEGVGIVKVAVGGPNIIRVGEAAGATWPAGSEFVVRALPAEVRGHAVVLIPVVVESPRVLVAVVEVTLVSRAEDGDAGVLEGHRGRAGGGVALRLA